MARIYTHRPAEERFWTFVNKTATCWLWTGVRHGPGYGRFRQTTKSSGRQAMAHRYSYELVHGPIPEGLQIDHLCRNPSCVRPDHLEAVTARENTMRSRAPSARNARKTHCPKGHPLSGDNVRLVGGRRNCSTCKREWVQRKRANVPRLTPEQRSEIQRQSGLRRWAKVRETSQ